MSTITRFEEIDSWIMARELTKAVYAASNEGLFARDFGVRDQMRRAAVSIMSNIAEGFERDGSKEFIYFLSMAKGSCGELKSQLYVAFDQEYISQEKFNELSEKATRIGRAINGFRKYLINNPHKGLRFKEDEAPYGEIELSFDTNSQI